MKPFKTLAIAVAVSAAAVLGSFVHYYMPRGEVVVLTGTEIMRFDNGRDGAAVDATHDGPTRDVRLIYARTTDAKSVRTYRNEDAIGYLKFDSGSLNSEVQSLLLDQQKGQELHVRALSYGWRIEFFSMYPNLISLKKVAPGYSYFPWHAISLLGFIGLMLAAAAYGVFRVVRAGKAAAQAAAERAAQAARDAAEAAALAARNATTSVVGDAGDAAARTAKAVDEFITGGTTQPAAPAPNVSSER